MGSIGWGRLHDLQASAAVPCHCQGLSGQGPQSANQIRPPTTHFHFFPATLRLLQTFSSFVTFRGLTSELQLVATTRPSNLDFVYKLSGLGLVPFLSFSYPWLNDVLPLPRRLSYPPWRPPRRQYTRCSPLTHHLFHSRTARSANALTSLIIANEHAPTQLLALRTYKSILNLERSSASCPQDAIVVSLNHGQQRGRRGFSRPRTTLNGA